MKRIAGVGLLVFLVPMIQGALAPFFPSAFRPDLTLLAVFGLSLCWRNTATGLVFAATCGFVVDLFSGGLLGQHALMAVLVFAAARVLSVHVSMIGLVPQMIFAAVLTAVHALGMAALTSFFTAGAGPALWGLTALGPHIAVNAVIAPLAASAVAVIASWIAGEDAGRRPLRLATRSWTA